LRTLRTYLGRVIRNIARKLDGNVGLFDGVALERMLALARCVLDQKQRPTRTQNLSLHAPAVECIDKGKAPRPSEFGVKGLRCHRAVARQRRPVRHPCQGDARLPL
jgi:transposase, IS5 family